jgi:RNA polymerase sigma factor (sigma-70 family)
VTVDERDNLAEQFEDHRTHLRAVAYRMLGSVSEADDAVQEAWLRLSRSDRSEIENLGGWLTTVVARVCLNMLRSRKSRREESLEVHMPDPVVSGEDGGDPEYEALLADSVGLALLVVLDAFFAAAREGDFEALVAVLDPDVVLRSDGGVARPAASALVQGARAVAERALTFAHLSPFVRPALVNGVAGVVVAPRGRPFSVVSFTVVGGKIVAIDALADPARLRRLEPAV